MGILINLLLSFVHLVLIAIDVTIFFVLIRILCYRWHSPWLESFNFAGQPLVNRLNNCTAKLSNRITHKSFSQKGLLNISIIALVIARIFLIALFSKKG